MLLRWLSWLRRLTRLRSPSIVTNRPLRLLALLGYSGLLRLRWKLLLLLILNASRLCPCYWLCRRRWRLSSGRPWGYGSPSCLWLQLWL